MGLIREYTTQTVLCTLQSTVVVAGWMCFATKLKILGYPDAPELWDWWVRLLRNWGMLWLLIPGAWVVFSVWMEQKSDNDFSQRWTVVTGVGVLVILAFYFFIVTITVGSTLIRQKRADEANKQEISSPIPSRVG
ncbi:MAG: hypothetical protein KA152_18295 [Verrucomicrobiales bacterium]|nr:hypothetical protein [Verrucomicrobiales bacterium]